MTADDRDRILADCLEDYHRRRALGEGPATEDYREMAGEAFEELAHVIQAESALDLAIDPPPAGPAAALPQTFGEYTLVGELGRGAMGVVYEAVHRSLGRRVALKVLRTGIDTEPELLERFRREARACAQIRHPNVVEVYDAGDIDGRPFYTMAFLEAKPLSDFRKEGYDPTPEEFCEAMAGVADALATLHGAGIIHRDVKPSNILVAPDGRMILADFGLARTAAAHRLTTTGQALGTPLYMSPEQVIGRGREVDGRADIYALGASMYEMLTGRAVFDATSGAAMLRMVLQDRPESPRTHRPDLPRGCERIILKALEKRREDRYQTAEEMREDLLAFAKGEQVAGRPVSRTRRSLRRARRYAPVVAAAVLLIVVGTWFWSNRDARLTVRCFPQAVVKLDGKALGSTPYSGEVAPGEHRLLLELPGFNSAPETIRLTAGAEKEIRQVLVAADPTDPAAQERLIDGLGLAMAPLSEPSGTRGEAHGLAIAVLPRGTVCAADLEAFRIDLGIDFPGGGRLEWRRNGEVLHSAPFDPESMRATGSIPGEVRDALQVGDVVTWGWFPDDGDPATAEFTLAADPDAEVLARLALELADQPAGILGHVRARFLLDRGHHQAALAEATTLTAEFPQSVPAWTVMRNAVAAMGLADTQLWKRALEGLQKAQ